MYTGKNADYMRSGQLYPLSQISLLPAIVTYTIVCPTLYPASQRELNTFPEITALADNVLMMLTMLIALYQGLSDD